MDSWLVMDWHSSIEYPILSSVEFLLAVFFILRWLSRDHDIRFVWNSVDGLVYPLCAKVSPELSAFLLLRDFMSSSFLALFLRCLYHVSVNSLSLVLLYATVYVYPCRVFKSEAIGFWEWGGWSPILIWGLSVSLLRKNTRKLMLKPVNLEHTGTPKITTLLSVQSYYEDE